MKWTGMRAFRRRLKHPLSWRRRLKLLLLDLLGREEPPRRVAAAIAVGVGVGFSPFLGLHLLLAIALAFLFRLNKLDAVLGQFAGNPWTFPPVFALGYRLGRVLLGYDRVEVPPLNWKPLLDSDLTWILHPGETLHLIFGGSGFLPRLLSFAVGTSVLSIVIGLSTYAAARTVLERYHRRHPRVATRAAGRRAALSRKKRARASGSED